MFNAPDIRKPRYRWLRIAAAVIVALIALGAAIRWLARDPFAAEVERIGGRYRQEVLEPPFIAFLRMLYREPLTVFHYIDLERSEVDDAWLLAHRDNFRRLTNLTLTVRSPIVTADGLSALNGLTKLGWLDLYGMPLDDSAVETLVTLKYVVNLNIARTDISDAALPQLASLQFLAFLNIDGSQATEAGIASLQTWPKLEGLWVFDADADCVARVATLKRLKSLYLHGDQLTAESLASVKQLPKLELLNLVNTDLTDEELNQLRQSLPGCTVQQMLWLGYDDDADPPQR